MSKPAKLLLLTESRLTAQAFAAMLQGKTDLEWLDWISASGAVFHPLLKTADLLIFDFEGLGPAALDRIAEIRDAVPGPRRLAIGVWSENAAVDAIAAGAQSIAMRHEPVDSVFAIIQQTLRGQTVCGPRVMAKVFSRIGELSRAQRREISHEISGGSSTGGAAQALSCRERQVLELLAEGLRNKEIAKRLDIAFSTAKNHVQNILEKLQVNTRLEAIRLACEHGLVDIPMPWQSA